MQKSFYIAFIGLLCSFSLIAQQQGNIHMVGDELTVLPGTSVYIKGKYQDQMGTLLFNGQNASGSIVNGDSVFVSGDIINDSDFKVNISDNGSFILDGNAIQIIEGNPVKFHQLIMDKDTSMVPYQYILVTDSLRFLRGFINLDSIISGVDLGNFGKIYEEANDKRFFGRLGKIVARNRAISSPEENIGGLALDIDPAGSLGPSTIERQHGYQAGASDGSINRYYRLIPSNKEETLNSLAFRYFDAELRGLNEENFSIWESDNEGVLWTQYETVLENPNNKVTGNNIVLGRDKNIFTAADSTCAVVPIVELSPRDSIATCEGVPVELNAANPGLFFLWNTGETTQKISVNTPGKYYVRVTDTNGCFGTDSIVVVEKPYPEVDFQQSFVCKGLESSFTNLSTIADPKSDLSYAWHFGFAEDASDSSLAENPIITFPEDGAFNVTLTVTSSFECVADRTKTYVVHPLPEPSFTTTNVCQGNENVFSNTSTILSNIGAVSYAITDYDWDFGIAEDGSDQATGENPTFDYPDAGEFEVQLVATSNAGCKDTISAPVTVFPGPIVDFTAENVCIGTDINAQNLSSIATGTMEYAWDFQDGSTSNEKFPFKKFVSAGDYTVSLTATSDKNCVATIEKTVEAYAIPEPSFSVESACFGEPLIVSNNTTIADDSSIDYQWTIEGGRTSIAPEPQAFFDAAGDYTFSMVATSNRGCKDSLSRAGILYARPVADFYIVSVCEGEPLRVINKSSISQGDITYLWLIDGQEVSSVPNPVFEGLTAGQYEVELRLESEFACEDSKSLLIEVFPLPEIDLPAQLSTCGDQLVLDAGNTGSRYLWSNNSTNQRLTVTQPGNYSVTVISPNGCVATATTQVSFDQVFDPNLPESIESCGPVTLDAGNPGSQSYSWSTGATTREIEVSESGTYKVDIVDQNGCPGSQSISVTIEEIPELTLPESITACAGDMVLLETDLEGVSHVWSTGETGSSINPDQSGTYSVEVTTPQGCTIEASTEVSFIENIIIDLGEDGVYCDEQILTIPEFQGEIIWSTGETGNSITVTESGTYSVEVFNANGCSGADTITIEILDSPEPVLPEQVTACSGETVVLDAQNAGLTYEWSTGATTQTIELSTSQTVSVIISNENLCSIEQTVDVIINPKVDFDLGPNLSICAGSDVLLDPGISGAGYSWSLNGSPISSDASIMAGDQGVYSLELEDEFGCIGTDSIELLVSEGTVISRFLAISEAFIGDTVHFKNISIPLSAQDFWSFGDGIRSQEEDPSHIFLRAGEFPVSLRVVSDACEDELIKPISINDPSEGRLAEPEEVTEEDPFLPIFIKDSIATLNVFPNPFNDIITVDLEKSKEGPVLILCYDLNGKLWFKEEYFSIGALQRSYNLMNMPAGQYILAVKSRGNEIYRQIIKY